MPPTPPDRGGAVEAAAGTREGVARRFLPPRYGNAAVAARAVAVAIGTLLVAADPLPAAMQYGLQPHVGVSETYDDNIFSAPKGGTTVVTGTTTDPSDPPETRFVDREDDLITRITPGLRAAIDTGYFSLRGGYRFSAAYYADNSQLDRANHGQDGGINTTWQATERLNLSLFGSYRTAESARELNAGTNPLVTDPDLQFATGVETRRGRSQSWSVGPTASYLLDELTRATAAYHYAGGRRRRGLSTDHHSASVSLHRTLTPLDVVDLRYGITGFDFSGTSDPNSPFGDDPGGSLSHSITVGWARLLGPLTSFTARVGPRITEGELRSADAHVSLRRAFQNGAATIGYSRQLGSVLGVAGTFDSDRAWIGGAYVPYPDVGTHGRFTWFRNDGGGFDANTYLASTGVSYPLQTWLFLQTSYQFRFQDQRFFGFGGDTDEVYRNVILVQLSATWPLGTAGLLSPFPGIDPALAEVLGSF